MQVFLEELKLLTNGPVVHRTNAEENVVYKDAFTKWRALSDDEQIDILFIRDLDVNIKHTIIREQECTRIDSKSASIIRLADFRTNLFEWLEKTVKNPRLSFHYTNSSGIRVEATIRRNHVEGPKSLDRKRKEPVRSSIVTEVDAPIVVEDDTPIVIEDDSDVLPAIPRKRLKSQVSDQTP